jgi:hypothetical protein
VAQAESGQNEFDVVDDAFAAALGRLVERMVASCTATQAWPSMVGAGLYAAVDFLIEEPEAARTLLTFSGSSHFGEPFRSLIHRMSQLLEDTVPVPARFRPDAPAAMMAGIGLLVGEHVRIGHVDRLAALRPDLHLLILLPFLDFQEAKAWADASVRTSGIS